MTTKYRSIFKMPKAVTVMGRSSSITNSLINGIIPVVEPSDEDIEEVLRIFGFSEDNLRCAYCGDKSTEWDHLQPLIKNKRPTGFISEIQNLVPACGKCNQSKGNQNWYDWINGSAKQSPYSRNISDLNKKIARIREFENWKKTTNIDFQNIVGSEKWEEYVASYTEIIKSMERCQIVSNDIKGIIKSKLRKVEVVKKVDTKPPGFTKPKHFSKPREFNYSSTILPIELNPLNESEFKRKLLYHKRAFITTYFADGTEDRSPWNANRFTETSNVMGNLRSRPNFRNGNWQSLGIIKVFVSIDE